MQAEVAEVAGLAVHEEVVVGPLRGLHDDGAGAPVGARELPAAAVGGHPAAGAVHRPPVVAEAGVGGDAARQPADAEERVRRSGGRLDPVRVQQRLAAIVGAGDREQGDAGPVAGGGGQAAAGHGATPTPSTATKASRVQPRSAHRRARRRRSAAGGPLAHPVEHLGVGGAVAEPGARGDAGPHLAQQGAGVAAGGEAAEQPRGQAVGVAVVLDPVDAGGHRERRPARGCRRSRCRPARARGRSPGRSAPGRPPGPRARRGAPAPTWSSRHRGRACPDPARRRTTRARPCRRRGRAARSSTSPRATPRARRPGPRPRRPPSGRGARRQRAAVDGRHAGVAPPGLVLRVGEHQRPEPGPRGGDGQRRQSILGLLDSSLRV